MLDCMRLLTMHALFLLISTLEFFIQVCEGIFISLVSYLVT